MSFGLSRLNELPPTVGVELDQLTVGIRDQVETEHDEEGRHLPWEDFAPEWRAATTMPAISNGSIVGRWGRVGRFVSFWMQLTIGSGTTMGTGRWSFSLPVRPRHANNVFAGLAFDASATPRPVTPWAPVDLSSQHRFFRLTATDGSDVDVDTPFTWAVGDVLLVSGRYEAAEDE